MELPRYSVGADVRHLVHAYEDDPTRGDLTPAQWMERNEKARKVVPLLSTIAASVTVAYG